MIAALAILSLLAAHPRAPAPKADPCARLDAASIPSCAGRLPQQDEPSLQPKAVNSPPKQAANEPSPAVNAPAANAPAPKKSAAKPSKPSAKLATNAPAKPEGPLGMAASLLRERPILVGGASGLLVLLVIGGTVVGITRAGRRAGADLAPPGGSPPTRWRRDLVLTDQDGRDWRIDGAHLTPSAIVGSDPASDLRRGDAGIAPRHAEFWVREGRLMLRRLADPVFLNDRLLKDVTPERVSTGDQLRLGSTTFTITID
jgi:hypothetical protein